MGLFRMQKQDKGIAYFLIFQAVVGGLVFAHLAVNTSIPLGVWVVFAPLIAAALAAGIGSLARKRWAAILGAAVFAAQAPIFASHYFSYSAWLGIHLDFAFNWNDQAKIGVNVFALVMLIWSGFRLNAADSPFKETTPSESA